MDKIRVSSVCSSMQSIFLCIVVLLVALSTPAFSLEGDLNEGMALTQNDKMVLIQGKVLDKDTKEPIVGATIIIEGSADGAITGPNGEYSLYVPTGGYIITSYLGYEEKRQEVYKSEKNLIILLNVNTTDIENVVITGYETLNSRRSTGAITSVKADEVLVPGMTSIDQALAGRIPDLVLTNNSGEVGSTARVRVRGTSTILGNREPLWVLDGFILTDPVDVSNEDLNNPDYINIVGNAIMGVNPQDIERIDVLKDAAATALYGTQAANGVIVITTKRGAIGKPSVSYNHSTKFTRRPRYTDNNILLMNSQERVQFGKDLTETHYQFSSAMPMVGYEGAYSRWISGESSYEDFLDEVTYYETVNTDWFDILTQDTFSTDHTLSISGGSEDTRYYVSAGYNNEMGVSKTTYNDRFTIRSNLDMNIGEKIKASFSLSGNVIDKSNLMSAINAMDYAYNTTRALPAYNPDGTLYYYERAAYGHGQAGQEFSYNVLNEIENSSSTYRGNTIAANATIRYSVMTELDITAAGSYSYSSAVQEEWWGEQTNYMALYRNVEYGNTPPTGEAGDSKIPYGGTLKHVNTSSTSFTFRTQYDFRKYFGDENLEDRHFLSSTGGFEMNGSNSRSFNITNYGYLEDRGLQYISDVDKEMYPHYIDLINDPNKTTGYGIGRTISGYITVGYSYGDHFTLSTNARLDGSNKFGAYTNSRFLPVISISGNWNMEQNVLRRLKFVDRASLRASYGVQGATNDSQSPNLVISQGLLDPYYGEYSSSIARYPNPNLLWERTKQVNVSLDATFLNNRFSIGLSGYHKLTDDVLSEIGISSVNGVPGHVYIMNDGSITNLGYSVWISGTPIQTNDLRVNLSGYFSGNKNTINSDVESNVTYGSYLSGMVPIDGKPLSTFYSYEYLGLNPTNGVPIMRDYQDEQHLLEGMSLEELIMFTMVESGQRDPKLTGGFNTNITYKRFSLGAGFAFSFGGKMRLFSLYQPIFAGVNADKNVRFEFNDRWQYPGDENTTDVPAILNPNSDVYLSTISHYSTSPGNSEIPVFASNTWDMYDYSDLRVVSSNYVKCQSLSIRYNFSKMQLKSLPFQSVNVSLNALNLFTISSRELDGQDPSQAGFSTPNLSLRPSYTLQFSITL